jgi:hypothetical protein
MNMGEGIKKCPECEFEWARDHPEQHDAECSFNPLEIPALVGAAFFGSKLSECEECGFTWASPEHERHAEGCSQWFNTELEIKFTYHKPKLGQAETYVLLRNHARHLAELFIAKCPDCRERSLAITKLEEAVMWANAGIARRS